MDTAPEDDYDEEPFAPWPIRFLCYAKELEVDDFIHDSDSRVTWLNVDGDTVEVEAVSAATGERFRVTVPTGDAFDVTRIITEDI